MKDLLCFTACAVACGGFLHPSQAEPPKGYQEVRVTDDPATFERNPKINNRGQIVFSSRNPGDGSARNYEIFLYDNGQLIQITNDRKADAAPDINDDGTIVWSRYIGPEDEFGPTPEIMVRTPEGRITRLTDNDYADVGPRINNPGHIAWYRYVGYGCLGVVMQMDLMFHDGTDTVRLTFDGENGDGIANQLGDINDYDEIAFTKYYFCVIGWWDSDIILYRQGRFSQLDPEYSFEPQAPTINNDGVVIWMNNFNEDGRHGLQMWDHGRVSDLTNWGAVPVINARGDIVFHRWYDAEQTYEVWRYRNGRISTLTSDQGYNYVPDMNDSADVVFQCGPPWVADVRLLVNGGGLHLLGDARRIPPP
ncbi:MAG: hypothetical protein IT449_17410 [Phycisphaerales bacterium]|nr:hypothetical protein [Phycisphaerales bacterium]